MGFISEFSLVLIISVLLVGFVEVSKAESSEKKLVCYYGSWAHYRYGNGKCDVEDLDPHLCTHLIYTFVNVGLDGSIVLFDSYLDIDLGNFEKFTGLKKKNKNLKTLIAIGGWSAGTAVFSKVSSDPTLRAKFVQSALDFTIKYNFDGMDLDWEYPQEKNAFSALVEEMYSVFNAKGLLLTAAVAAGKSQASISYDIPVISKYLDFINVMTYDFHGSWETQVGFNSPLDSENKNDQLLVKKAIEYWILQGAPEKKLILGMPLYGKTFKLSNSASTKPGSPSSGAGIAGPYTQQPGTIGLNELCEMNLIEKWFNIWDEEAQVPYAYKDLDWISYENVRSLQKKSQFALEKNLGGGMVWSIETDDFKNVCGNGNFVYLNAIKSALNNNQTETESTTVRTSTTESSTSTSSSTIKTSTEPSASTPTTTASSTPATTQPSISTSTMEPTTTHITTQPSIPTTTTSSSPTTSQTSTTSSTPTTIPQSACKESGVNKHPTNAHKFISCVRKEDGSYVIYEMDCPANLIFDENLKACTYEVHSLLKDTVCKEPGNNKHPTNPHKYYYCVKKVDGTYIKHGKPCPVNLVYDEKSKNCNYP